MADIQHCIIDHHNFLYLSGFPLSVKSGKAKQDNKQKAQGGREKTENHSGFLKY